MSAPRLLDYWSPPDGAGAPMAVLATTFTLQADFFDEDCLARFLSLAIAFGMFAVFSHQRIRYEYGIRALDIARVLSDAPLVRTGVSGIDAQ